MDVRITKTKGNKLYDLIKGGRWPFNDLDPFRVIVKQKVAYLSNAYSNLHNLSMKTDHFNEARSIKPYFKVMSQRKLYLFIFSRFSAYANDADRD